MKKIKDKQCEEYLKYKSDESHGRFLTPEGLRFIIQANNYDAEDIGKYFLNLLPRLTPRG